ncbi:hypothetical protein [Pararhizobium sp.]|uniref:hypothetical protein n=1 Tax=Pararhizobium sp. TaxID=1977563 RepID=UPI0027229E4D|nr:hypothetical protein [Pararhizobium sp.]MDO9418945.1 hypothetical protein [Pararhizobium sp.]
MNFVSQPRFAAKRHPRGTTRSGLIGNPAFLIGLKTVARDLITLHEQCPKAYRLVSSQQKWLLTQAAYALHLERAPGKPLSGITASRLLDIIVTSGAASRNTTTAFLAELIAYRLLRPTPDNPNRRSRPLETTEISDQVMTSWFLHHMGVLDLIDGGDRQDRIAENNRLFRLAQPLAARRLIADPAWREPPESIGIFVWSQSGAVLIDDLVARIEGTAPLNGKHSLGELRLSELSDRYRVSPTHMRRVFARAEKKKLLGWHEPGRKGGVWMSESLLRDYVSWQAVKFEALSDAYDQALERTLAPADLPLRRGFQGMSVSCLQQ